MPALRPILADDCPPTARSVSIYDRCGVHFPQLPGLFMPGVATAAAHN